MAVDTAKDAAAYLESALGEVCFGDEDRFPLEATIDRYFAPDYQQRTDGELVDREGFAEHIRALRGLVAEGHIEVVEVVREGRRIAGHHLVTVTKCDGSSSKIEVYLFGEFADDGRLRRVDEVSRVVTGSEEDGNLARTR